MTSVIKNLTTNEMAKYEKYDYLKDANGKAKNLFDRGFFYNIKYYFYLIEPSKLESVGIEENEDYFV